MRLVMMGTGPFAVPTYRGLYGTHHEVAALFTAPVRSHRGKKVAPVSEIRDIAHEHGTPIFDPEDVNMAESRAILGGMEAELLIVCDYGQILSTATLATARFGGINLHGSLLPKYRGAAPVNWAVYNGDGMSGVTVIHMTPRVDAGPCIAQAQTLVNPEETAEDLEVRLADLGQWLMLRAIGMVEEGHLEALPQDPNLACRAPRLKKSDGQIDWARTALQIKNHIRAMHPWPKTYTYWHSEGHPAKRLILGPADAVKFDTSATPGTVVEVEPNRLVIATGQGGVAPRSVQPAGKKLLDIEVFLRGYHLKVGDLLGPESLE